jgi:hypothetical protein
VVDFENTGAVEPEYELRGFPGPGWGPGLAARFSALSIAPKRHQQLTSGDSTDDDRHTTPRRLEGSSINPTTVWLAQRAASWSKPLTDT